MTEHHTHKQNTVYECVDKDAEGVLGSIANTNGALIPKFKLIAIVFHGLLMILRKKLHVWVEIRDVSLLQMLLHTHLVFKYYKEVMDVMEYLVFLDQQVLLVEMVPMDEMDWKETKKNKNLKGLLEKGVWCLPDGEDFLVQIQKNHNCYKMFLLLSAVSLTEQHISW